MLVAIRSEPKIDGVNFWILEAATETLRPILKDREKPMVANYDTDVWKD
jgi:hypothetical protein